jgi:hypothetical protein
LHFTQRSYPWTDGSTDDVILTLPLKFKVDDDSIASHTHNHPSHSQTSRLLSTFPLLSSPIPPLHLGLCDFNLDYSSFIT